MISPAWVETATAANTTLYFSGSNTTWDNATTKDWSPLPNGPYTSLWSSGSDAQFQNPAGTVTVSGSIASVRSLTFNATGYTLTGGSINLTGSGGSIDVVSGNATINSVLSGFDGLTKTGAGLLTLGGANVYTNGTTITAGSLSVGNAACFGSGPITLAGGTLVNNLTVANNLVAAASTTSSITPTSDSATIFSGSLTGSGVVNFSGGAGVQTFMNGDLSAFAGTLAFGASGSGVWFNGATGTATTFSAGAGDIFAFASTAVGAQTFNLGALSGVAGSHIYSSANTANAITLSIGALNTWNTFAGVIQNDALSATDTSSTVELSKVGSGTLTLSGSNTYTGLTSIDAGTLSLRSTGAWPATAISPSAAERFSSPQAIRATMPIASSTASVRSSSTPTGKT